MKADCPCRNKKYRIPNINDWPLLLQNLSTDDEQILRIFNIDCGLYSVRKRGYRVKTAAISLHQREDSVEERICNVVDPLKRKRLEDAFEYLMLSDESSYNEYYVMNLEMKVNKIPFYKAFQMDYLETAIWPILYFAKWLCPSHISSSETHASSRSQFMMQCRSTITDYADCYELLQYQYERWLYKTVSGAIEVGKKLKCSPAKSLETKTITAMYWTWQHRYLIDAVRQFGYPHLFITISPYEWTFPKVQWLAKSMQLNQRTSTEYPVGESLHVAHVLEQIVRGYLTGTNSSSHWKDNILANTRKPSGNNVLTYFLRDEYATKMSLHIHLLVWLKTVKYIHLNRFSADLPITDEEFSHTVSLIF